MTQKQLKLFPNNHRPLGDEWDNIPVSTQKPGVKSLENISPQLKTLEEGQGATVGSGQPINILSSDIAQKGWDGGGKVTFKHVERVSRPSPAMQIMFIDNPNQDGLFLDYHTAYVDLNTEGAVGVGPTHFYFELDLKFDGELGDTKITPSTMMVIGYCPYAERIVRAKMRFSKPDGGDAATGPPLKLGLNKLTWQLYRDDMLDPEHPYTKNKVGKDRSEFTYWHTDIIFLGWTFDIFPSQIPSVPAKAEYTIKNFKMAKSNYKRIDREGYQGGDYYTSFSRDETDNLSEMQVMYHGDTTLADHLKSPPQVRVL